MYAGELAAAIREHTKIRFGLYYSLFEWYNRLYIEDRNNNFTTRRFVEMKTMPELQDLVSHYELLKCFSSFEFSLPIENTVN